MPLEGVVGHPGSPGGSGDWLVVGDTTLGLTDPGGVARRIPRLEQPKNGGHAVTAYPLLCGSCGGSTLGSTRGGEQTWLSRCQQLFRSLRDDFTTLKRELAADIKDLKKEVIDLGERVDTIEKTHDEREEGLNYHRRELLTLQDKNQDLQYQLKDLENRSRRSNIRIKGVPAQAVAGSLEDFVVRLFRHVAPALKEQDIVLD
ncbi:hypothetical protein NDU88_011263 [Pleurodeles waltl]|uniref:Uncharacterized protein n=1 Tax=Pleurodeles waltl TaxID=8319 RepID=A0AAV7R0W6_PLEWA|nr:hypothetical protein NDU88_011263 [Pleurodeles waltl]